MADDPLVGVELDSSCTARTARKAYTCVCADRLRGYELIITAEPGLPWLSRTRGTAWIGESDLNALVKREKAKPGVASVEVRERANPNFRPDCIRFINPGDRYVEYLGDSWAWESGSRYCAPCGTAVWSKVASR